MLYYVSGIGYARCASGRDTIDHKKTVGAGGRGGGAGVLSFRSCFGVEWGVGAPRE